MLNPASTPQERLAASRKWAYELKALSPYDGLNQNENGKFSPLRELSLTYNVPASYSTKLGFSHMSITAAGRNLALWTPIRASIPRPTNTVEGARAPTSAASIRTSVKPLTRSALRCAPLSRSPCASASDPPLQGERQ